MDFQGKHILVLGAGISGMAVAKILQEQGAQVVLNDAKPAELLNKDFTALTAGGVQLALGYQDSQLLNGIDYLVLSPGISIYIPLVQVANERKIPVMSEVEVAYQLCRAPIVAVTGTNGKTTTTTLIGEMLKTANSEVVVGGNIGLALSQEVQGVSENGIVVAEISSFQLEAVRDFRPHIAAILNLTPDHIDRHRTMETYQAMKERIFAKQQADDYLVLNYDDAAVRAMAARASSRVLFFSRQAELEQGAFVKNGVITIGWQEREWPVCPVADMKLFGAHNIENALAACAIAFLAGVPAGEMAGVLKTFAGVEHRIEPVAALNGVTYYNDSKATNPESSIKALEAFPGHIILIAGGRDKNTDLTEFMKLVRERADELILIGEAQARFAAAAAAQGVDRIHPVDSLEEAVDLAYRTARAPQVVLLSPACASYDMFRNYEERGRVFKELIRKLH